MLRELVQAAEKIEPSTYCAHCDHASQNPCICQQTAQDIVHFELAIEKAKALLED